MKIKTVGQLRIALAKLQYAGQKGEARIEVYHAGKDCTMYYPITKIIEDESLILLEISEHPKLSTNTNKNDPYLVVSATPTAEDYEELEKETIDNKYWLDGSNPTCKKPYTHISQAENYFAKSKVKEAEVTTKSPQVTCLSCEYLNLDFPNGYCHRYPEAISVNPEKDWCGEYKRSKEYLAKSAIRCPDCFKPNYLPEETIIALHRMTNCRYCGAKLAIEDIPPKQIAEWQAKMKAEK